MGAPWSVFVGIGFESTASLYAQGQVPLNLCYARVTCIEDSLSLVRLLHRD